MEPPAAESRSAEDRRLSFLLDTDACSAYIKGNALVFNRFVQYGGGLSISTVTLGELFTWALRAKAPPSRLQDVQDFLKLVSILEVTGRCRATIRSDQGSAAGYGDARTRPRPAQCGHSPGSKLDAGDT